MTQELALRYRKAPKKARGVTLDELCDLTGWHRDHARRALRAALVPSRPKARCRPVTYADDVIRPVEQDLGGPSLRPRGVLPFGNSLHALFV